MLPWLARRNHGHGAGATKQAGEFGGHTENAAADDARAVIVQRPIGAAENWTFVLYQGLHSRGLIVNCGYHDQTSQDFYDRGRRRFISRTATLGLVAALTDRLRADPIPKLIWRDAQHRLRSWERAHLAAPVLKR